MKMRFGLAVVLLMSAGWLYGQANVPAAPATAAAGTVGRYQLVLSSSPSNPEAWLIDTQTGDTWRRSTGGNWGYTGNPTQNPGPKVSAPRAPATAPQILPER